VQRLAQEEQLGAGADVGLARESSQRVRPGCPHFGLHAGACGGCKMQHLHPAAQVAVKQRVLEDNLQHLAKVRPERLLRPIEGPAWGYRWRARLSVRYVVKKGVVLVGFHERKSRYVADMSVCPVLPPAVSAMLVPLRELIGAMDQRDRLPQIELAVGDAVTALVLRHLEPLSAADAARLRAFAAAHGVQWWLQPKGPDTVHRLDERAGAGLRAARVRRAHALQADRLHAGQPAHQPRAGGACAAAAGAAARRARDRLVLRPGQLHAAAGHARGARCWASRAARCWCSARATTRAQRPGRQDQLRGAQPVRDRRRRPGGRRPAEAGWSTRRARAPSRWPRRWPTCTPRRWPAGSRRGASSTSAATRPRWRATPGCWCTRPATAARRPAW
jgi:hypothetical protein